MLLQTGQTLGITDMVWNGLQISIRTACSDMFVSTSQNVTDCMSSVSISKCKKKGISTLYECSCHRQAGSVYRFVENIYMAEQV